MSNKFLMWGERGLVATLFHDLSRIENKAVISDFLNLIQWNGENNFYDPNNNFDSIKYIVEPDFGNKGFGHPDGLIVFKNGEKTTKVIVLEAKKGDYNKASVPTENRGMKKFNSMLNGQLELNYCLTLALSAFDSKRLVDPDWVLNTPYNMERVDKKRYLVNNYVLENVVKELSGLPLNCYYHLILTNDRANPFTIDDNKEKLPEIFTEEKTNENQWGQLKKFFGFISYSKIKDFYEDKANHYFEENKIFPLFPATFEYNNRAVDVATEDENCEIPRTDKGRKIILAPEIDPDNSKRLYVFYWEGESASLRYYEEKENNSAKPLYYPRKYIEEKMDETFNEIAPRKNVNDINFWTNHNSETKEKWNLVGK